MWITLFRKPCICYQERTAQPVPEADLQCIIEEFSRPGVAEAVPRYFRDMSEEVLHQRVALYRQMRFPALLLQGALDPAQPRRYFERAVSLFPDAELHVVPDAGHFIELERPDIVTAEIRTWVRRSKADHAWRPREDESWL